MKEKNGHPLHFYKHEPKKTLINDEARHNDQKSKNCWPYCNNRRIICKIEFGNSSGTLRCFS